MFGEFFWVGDLFQFGFVCLFLKLPNLLHMSEASLPRFYFYAKKFIYHL